MGVKIEYDGRKLAVMYEQSKGQKGEFAHLELMTLEKQAQQIPKDRFIAKLRRIMTDAAEPSFEVLEQQAHVDPPNTYKKIAELKNTREVISQILTALEGN